MSDDAQPWEVLVLPPLGEDAARGMVEGLLPDLPLRVTVPARRDQEAVQEALAGADLVVGDWTGALRLGEAEVAAAPRLALVAQPSVGVDHVDGDALAAAGVPLANIGDANAVSVAEWCLGAALDLVRGLTWADADTRAGGWAQVTLEGHPRRELSALRVGVVGFGNVGQATARAFSALGCAVRYWTRTRRPAEVEQAAGASYAGSVAELCAGADVVVVVIARAPGTLGLLGARELDRLPEGAYLVNAARGGIVDEDALLAALASGRMGGAMLDVYATEPLPADSPLRDSPRLVLSPHAAGSTADCQARLVRRTMEHLREAVEGRPVTDVVNGADPLVRRRSSG